MAFPSVVMARADHSDAERSRARADRWKQPPRTAPARPAMCCYGCRTSCEDLFEEWLREHYPERAEHVLSLFRQCDGGRLNDSTFSQPPTRGRALRGSAARSLRASAARATASTTNRYSSSIRRLFGVHRPGKRPTRPLGALAHDNRLGVAVFSF